MTGLVNVAALPDLLLRFLGSALHQLAESSQFLHHTGNRMAGTAMIQSAMIQSAFRINFQHDFAEHTQVQRGCASIKASGKCRRYAAQEA